MGIPKSQIKPPTESDVLSVVSTQKDMYVNIDLLYVKPQNNA